MNPNSILFQAFGVSFLTAGLVTYGVAEPGLLMVVGFLMIAASGLAEK